MFYSGEMLYIHVRGSFIHYIAHAYDYYDVLFM